jgi:hypothetical protein
MSVKMILGSNRCCINDIFRGIPGPEGRIGVGGPIGIMGNIGPTGTTGPQGDTGLCYRGYKGPMGPQGPQGGTQGAVGLMGPSGSPGTEVAQNSNFSFTTSSPTISSSSGFIELTSLANVAPSNSITLPTNGNYLVKFMVELDWLDSGNKFYVRFNNGSSYEHPTVFNDIRHLVLNSEGTKLNGIGNDLVNFSSTNYTIELLHSTTSGAIDISNKNVKFSITFIKLS